MSVVAEIAFGVVVLAIGLVATFNPSGVRLFYERLGTHSPLSQRTVHRSIRLGGIVALLMGIAVFAALIYAS